jgi:hypothetical protein
MLYLSLGFGAIFLLLIWSLAGHDTLLEFASLSTLLVGALLYYMIGRGKNWARTTFLILFVLALPSTRWSWTRSGSDPAISGWIDMSLLCLGIAEVVLQFVALALLFQQVSTDWFRSMKNQHS